jgi:hypothetical protein
MAVRSLSLSLAGLTGETGKMSLGERPLRDSWERPSVGSKQYGCSPIYRCVDVEPWSVIPEERQILVESDV